MSKKKVITQNLMSNKGHTLIELVVSLSIISLLYFISTPIWSYFDDKLFNLQVEKLYLKVSYLKQLAITTNTKQKLYFDNLPLGVLPNTLGPPSNPKSNVGKPHTFKDGHITFYPDGIISPGTVYLKSKYNMYAITCPISQISHIRKYKYANQKWVKL